MNLLFDLAVLSVGVAALAPVVVKLFGDREAKLVPAKAPRPKD